MSAMSSKSTRVVPSHTQRATAGGRRRVTASTIPTTRGRKMTILSTGYLTTIRNRTAPTVMTAAAA